MSKLDDLLASDSSYIKQQIKDVMLDLIKQSKNSGTPLLWLEKQVNLL